MTPQLFEFEDEDELHNLRIVAVHEAGHAVAFARIKQAMPGSRSPDVNRRSISLRDLARLSDLVLCEPDHLQAY